MKSHTSHIPSPTSSVLPFCLTLGRPSVRPRHRSSGPTPESERPGGPNTHRTDPPCTTRKGRNHSLHPVVPSRTPGPLDPFRHTPTPTTQTSPLSRSPCPSSGPTDVGSGTSSPLPPTSYLTRVSPPTSSCGKGPTKGGRKTNFRRSQKTRGRPSPSSLLEPPTHCSGRTQEGDAGRGTNAPETVQWSEDSEVNS